MRAGDDHLDDIVPHCGKSTDRWRQSRSTFRAAPRNTSADWPICLLTLSWATGYLWNDTRDQAGLDR